MPDADQQFPDHSPGVADAERGQGHHGQGHSAVDKQQNKLLVIGHIDAVVDGRTMVIKVQHTTAADPGVRSKLRTLRTFGK